MYPINGNNCYGHQHAQEAEVVLRLLGRIPVGLWVEGPERCPLCLEIPSNTWLIHHTHHFDCQWETISSLFPCLRSGKSYYGAFLLSAQQEQKTAPPLCLHVNINKEEFTVSSTSCMVHICLTIDRMMDPEKACYVTQVKCHLTVDPG